MNKACPYCQHPESAEVLPAREHLLRQCSNPGCRMRFSPPSEESPRADGAENKGGRKKK